MGVPRELQVVPGRLRGKGAARLVRQQHADVTDGRASHGGGRIGSGGEIRDARDHEPARSPLHHAMLVRKHRNAETLELVGPTADVPVVLVVTRHEVRAVRRPQAAQRRDVLP